MQLTIGRELLDKLERARELMMHANPKADLAIVVERAVDALLAKLEKERLAKTDRPQTKKKRPCAPEHVSAAVKREVFARDGQQCSYVDETTGDRCTARGFLELDHREPRAAGGSSDASNVRVLCRTHNRLHAEVCFGREHVQARIDCRRRKLDPEAAELVRSGLVHMGFRDAQAKKALGVVDERHANDDVPLPTEAILVEALRVLT
jgi:hypothetical protein